jgi:hypothetical protein
MTALCCDIAQKTVKSRGKISADLSELPYFENMGKSGHSSFLFL